MLKVKDGLTFHLKHKVGVVYWTVVCCSAQLQVMELAGSPGDASAGYMVEDSDLEYSDCFSGERFVVFYLMHTL